MRRARLPVGQIPFVLPTIRDTSRPSVMMHKNGRYLLFRPQDPIAAAIYSDLIQRFQGEGLFRNARFWNRNPESAMAQVKDFKKIHIWKHLEGDLGRHPICQILQANGVEVGVVPTLANYVTREYKRFLLENTPNETPKVDTNTPLYDRCSQGTMLRCIKNLRLPGMGTGAHDRPRQFEVGKYYLVTGVGTEDVDQITIGLTPVSNGMSFSETGDNFVWNPLDEALAEVQLETFFDDSEDLDLGATVAEVYPERVAAMRKRIDALGWDLFEHVKVDASYEALKRTTINGKLMRMGKTSEARTVLELWGSKKAAVFGSKNVIASWIKEQKRLGLTDHVVVKSLEDLKKPGRIFLMTYSWISQQKDPSEKQRANKTNRLVHFSHSLNVRVVGSRVPQPVEYCLLNHHPCPHCGVRMLRPVKTLNSEGRVIKVDWTPEYGYMCRNQQCSWTSDNRKKAGAAWGKQGIVQHKPGTYVDVFLARHAECGQGTVRGRQCTVCGEVDSVWVPQRSKRFKKEFTAVFPDEAHGIKNPNSLRHIAVARVRAKRKGPITGTLIGNGPSDAFPVMRWAFNGPTKVFEFGYPNGGMEFDQRFCDHITLEKMQGIDEETGEVIKKKITKKLPFLKNPSDWWRFLAPKYVRRNYSDPLYQESLRLAGMQQPNVIINKLACKMVPAQIQLMRSALKDFTDIYEKHKLEAQRLNKDINKAFVIRQMSAMCAIATSPEMMNERFGRLVYEGPDGGGKMYNIVMLTKAAVLAGGKVLILSNYRAMQKAVIDALRAEGLGVVFYNSGWDADRRLEAQEEFANNPEQTVTVAGTNTLTEAAEYSVCDTVIVPDVLWNPGPQSQAWSRALAPTKRKRDVNIYLMNSENSIDEHRYDTFYSKLVASEQAQDRKIINRRAVQVDIKMFADRVVEDEFNLVKELRDLGLDEDTFMVPSLGAGCYEERVA